MEDVDIVESFNFVEQSSILTFEQCVQQFIFNVSACKSLSERNLFYESFIALHSKDILQQNICFDELLMHFKQKRLTNKLPIYPDWLAWDGTRCMVCVVPYMINYTIPFPSYVYEQLTPIESWFYGCLIPITDKMSHRCQSLVRQYNAAKNQFADINRSHSTFKNGNYCAISKIHCVDATIIRRSNKMKCNWNSQYINPTTLQDGKPFIKLCESLHLFRFLIDGIDLPKYIEINITPSHILNSIPTFANRKIFYNQIWEYHSITIMSYWDDMPCQVNDIRGFIAMLNKNYIASRRIKILKSWRFLFPSKFQLWLDRFVIYIFDAILEFHTLTGMCHHDLTCANLLISDDESGLSIEHLCADLYNPIAIRISDFDLATYPQEFPIPHILIPETINPEYLIDYMTFLHNLLWELKALGNHTLTEPVESKIIKCLSFFFQRVHAIREEKYLLDFQNAFINYSYESSEKNWKLRCDEEDRSMDGLWGIRWFLVNDYMTYQEVYEAMIRFWKDELLFS